MFSNSVSPVTVALDLHMRLFDTSQAGSDCLTLDRFRNFLHVRHDILVFLHLGFSAEWVAHCETFRPTAWEAEQCLASGLQCSCVEGSNWPQSTLYQFFHEVVTALWDVGAATEGTTLIAGVGMRDTGAFILHDGVESGRGVLLRNGDVCLESN